MNGRAGKALGRRGLSTLPRCAPREPYGGGLAPPVSQLALTWPLPPPFPSCSMWGLRGWEPVSAGQGMTDCPGAHKAMWDRGDWVQWAQGQGGLHAAKLHGGPVASCPQGWAVHLHSASPPPGLPEGLGKLLLLPNQIWGSLSDLGPSMGRKWAWGPLLARGLENQRHLWSGAWQSSLGLPNARPNHYSES